MWRLTPLLILASSLCVFAGPTETAQASIDKSIAQSFADTCTIKDHYLWVNVEKDGKTVFTGAFAHWFSHAAVKDQLHKADQNLDKKVKQLDQKISTL